MQPFYVEAELIEFNVVTFIVRQVPLIWFLCHFTLDLVDARLFLAKYHISR